MTEITEVEISGIQISVVEVIRDDGITTVEVTIPGAQGAQGPAGAGGGAGLVDGDYGDLSISGSGTVFTVDSVQGRTFTTADAGADAFFGWDDSVSAYENLTAAEALEIIKTVDGVGSGLDADLLDGLSSAAFATAAHTHVAADITDFETAAESAIDTLANLTSIQGRTVTLADAGANAFFGWDDVAGAYENLTAAEAEAIIEPLIDTLANLTSVQGRTVTLADAGLDVVLGWDDSASAYKNFALTDITSEAVPAAGDYFLMYGAEGDLRRVNFSDMPGAGAGDDLGNHTAAQDLDMNTFNIFDAGVVFMIEQAAADADTAGSGQWWVQTATPNLPMFTNDAGTDFQLATLAGTENLTNKTLTGATVTGGTISNTTDISISATTESNIETAIDTLANLTSIQGRTVTLADAGANAFFGWDDVAGAYENLTAAEAEAIIEPLIDTLANLTSVQGRTVTLADAGLDVLFGWDDSGSAYKNFALADITSEAVPAAGDFFLMYGAEGDLRKVDFDDMPAGGGSGDTTGLTLATGNMTFYVRKDGSDSNTGLTDDAAGALLTITKAMELVADYNWDNQYVPTVQVRAGTYDEGNEVFPPPLVNQDLQDYALLIGDIATPSNVIVQALSDVFQCIGCSWDIQGFQINSTSAGGGIWCAGRTCSVAAGPIIFAGMPDHCIGVVSGARFDWNTGTALTVTGTNSRGLVRVDNYSRALFESSTVTITNAWAIPAAGSHGFVAVGDYSTLYFNNVTIVNPSNVSGRRYLLGAYALFHGAGTPDFSDPDALPGTTTGQAATIALTAIGLTVVDGEGIIDGASNELLYFQQTASAVNYLEVTNAAASGRPILSAAGSDTNVGLQFTVQGSPVESYTAPSIEFDVGSAQGSTFSVRSDNAGTIGPKLSVFHDSATPADNDDVGALEMVGRDSGGNTQHYASWWGKCVSTSTPSGRMIAYTAISGNDHQRQLTIGPGLALGDEPSAMPGHGNITIPDNRGVFDSNANEHLLFQQVVSAVNYLEATNAATGNSPSIAGTGSDAAVGLDILTRTASATAVRWQFQGAGHLVPATDATYDLGSSTVGVNDLHFGLAGVINFDGGDVTITHSANALDVDGGVVDFGSTPTVNGSAILTAATGQPLDSDLTSWALITRAAGFDTFATTPSSVNFAALVTGETGSGALVFGTSPGFTTAANPISNDGAALGETTTPLRWSDVFLADGGVVNLGTTSSKATITHTAASDSITISADPDNATATSQVILQVDGANEVVLDGTNFRPGANDGNALGLSGTAWSDLFLASGAIVDFNAGDVTVTHSANALTVAGGDLFVPDEVYDEAGWNGDLSVPTKNAVRDKIESLSGSVTDNVKTTSIGISIDGGGSAITTGIKGEVYIPFSGTIDLWTILADQTGRIEIDIWKDTFANYPPTAADSITGGASPAIVDSNKAQGDPTSDSPTWVLAVAAGDTLKFNVNSCTTITRATLVLSVIKT